MAVNDVHPHYAERVPEWVQIEDTYRGERAVKRKATAYLPATEAMVQDGMKAENQPGWVDYNAYRTRAHFYDVVKEAVKAMIGILQMKPAIIKLPAKMESLRNNATVQGEGLQMLLRRINEAQLLSGRCGLLVDVPTGADPSTAIPYLAFYDAERIINWDEGKENEGENQLELVVINESAPRRQGFTWKTNTKYRVLSRGPIIVNDDAGPPAPGDFYQLCVMENTESDPIPTDYLTPSIAGKPLDYIPFTFIGSDDLLAAPNDPPLLGLSNLALALYRGDADYRQTLYMQGQNTLVICGTLDDEEDDGSKLRVGAKGLILLRQGSTAEYIGVSAAGLGEMRQSIARDLDTANAHGTSFVSGDNQAESGEALRIRVAAKTTTLGSVSRASGAGLEKALKTIAEWMGANPDEVIVQPTTDFSDQGVQGAALLAFMQAKQLGLPLSLKSIHRLMLQNDMTDLDFEAENEQIEEEAETLIGMMVNQAGMVGDDSFLDDGDGSGTPGSAPPIPGNSNVPVTPHTRGSPKPLKTKVGKKGASAKPVK